MNAYPILLVEDDENDAFFFQRAAAKAGIKNPVHVVRDGREAVDYLSGNAPFTDRAVHPMPGLIVLDLHLPQRNGLEVLRWLRAHPATSSIIVLVLTSSNADRDKHEAYSFGANSYLVKPSNPEEMVDLLRMVQSYWLHANEIPPQDHMQHGASANAMPRLAQNA